ncbi:MAG: hypothetical protein GX752_07725 [Clostridium sp.]|nr:hypothetical protein [Clostridium sp.]
MRKILLLDIWFLVAIVTILTKTRVIKSNLEFVIRILTSIYMLNNKLDKKIDLLSLQLTLV